MSPDHVLCIGYVVERYPCYSETLLIDEMLAHEQAGHRLEIFSLSLPSDTGFQDAGTQVCAPVHYLLPPGKTSKFWQEVEGLRRFKTVQDSG